MKIHQQHIHQSISTTPKNDDVKLHADTENKEKNILNNHDAVSTPEELLKRIIEEDDLKGFELLHKHYYNILCNYACRFVDSKEAARDIVSDVFFRFWKNRKKLKIKSSCRAYFFTAVKNQAYNYLNREAKKLSTIDYSGIAVLSQDKNPEEAYLYNELSKQVTAAIDALSPQCKKVFTLSRFKGLKNDEVAKKLNISTKAVEAHMTRALKSLRHVLKNELPYLFLLFSSLF